MRKAVNSSNRTVVRKNRHNQAVRGLLDSRSKIVAKGTIAKVLQNLERDKEQSLFVSSSKNKVLTKEAGIAFLYKIGERG